MKRLFLALLAFAVVLTIGSCGKSSSGTLVYGTTDKVTQMDPASAYDQHTWELFNNINESLLTYKPGTTEIIPGLAESYTVNDKGDEYTFKLRKGLKFTDGTAFTADTVKWTIDRVVALKGDPSWLVTQFVKAVTVVDPLTVKFTLTGPTSFFPSVIAGNPPYYPLSPGVYPVDKIISDPTELKGGQLVGLGAYKITSFKRDEQVVLEANPYYYGAKPKIKKVIIRYFADATTMRLALEKGDIDLVYKSLNPSDIADLAKNPKITTNTLPGPFIRFLCFENSQSVFKNKKLRQAVTALINRPEINQKVYLGQNAPLYSLIPEGMAYHTEDFKTVYGDGNVAKAEELLKAAGYSAKKPLTFDLWYTPTHYGDTEKDLADVAKAQFEKTPLIKVMVKSAEWATYKQQFNKKQMAAYFLGWYPDYVDPDDYTAAFAQTDASAGEGIFFSNKDWDALFVKEEQSTDVALRQQLFEKVQKDWTDEVPCAPIFQGTLHVLTKQNLTGVKIGAPLIFLYNTLYFTK
ncbi:MAG: ABC transporter substrate-binding protein [Rectinemataceae bacterium]|jgi:peptide/nickel transport system substrate-binding protein